MRTSNPPQRRRASLSDRLPELAAEWHPTLNGALTFDQLSTASTIPVWWQCLRMPTHVWQASLKSRYSKHSGCRRCRLALRTYQGTAFCNRTLAVTSPAIAATWHPTKNGALTPHDVTLNSRYRAWWQCPIDPTHVFDTTVNNRRRSGCPYCAGHRIRKTSTRQRSSDQLLTTLPHLAKEWHPDLNEDRTPANFSTGSALIVWWQCPRDNKHTYLASIRSRTRLKLPVSCPECRRIKRELIRLHREAHTPMVVR